MNDLIPIILFAGCLLATIGLVRVCEWLRPIRQQGEHKGIQYAGDRGSEGTR